MKDLQTIQEITRRLRLVNLAAIVLVLPLTLAAFFLVPGRVAYEISEQYSIEADSAGARLKLAVLIPQSGPYQTIDHLSVFWSGPFTRRDAGPSLLLRFEDELGPSQKRQAQVRYRALLPSGKVRWRSPVWGSDLRAQDGIESDNRAIVHEAERLVTGRDRRDAYGIYAFTAAYLRVPDRAERDASALDAYRNKSGHTANLMTALCRAAGIPARSITGLTLPEMIPFTSRSARWGHAAPEHAWTEFFAGGRWELADAAVEQLLRPATFGRNDGRHIALGERAALLRVHEGMRRWSAAAGYEAGSMADGLYFAAGADREGARVQPQVVVRKLWDTRWLNLFAAIFLVFGPVRLYELHSRRRVVRLLPTAA